MPIRDWTLKIENRSGLAGIDNFSDWKSGAFFHLKTRSLGKPVDRFVHVRVRMKPADLRVRIEKMAVDVLTLSGPLLAKSGAEDMARQLRRSATGAAVNYGSACVARSHADFTSKIGVALEEMDETARWLRILRDTDLAFAPRLTALIGESQELTAILSASHRTAKRNRPLHQTRRP